MPPNELKQIVYLTAGAGGMFCGSCMHDNTLARGLQQLGIDVQLVPVYTPIRTDENDVTIDQVFFGGINVYLQQKLPLFRHLPRFVDRMLDSPWLIQKLTAKASATDPRLLGSLTLSMLHGIEGNQRKEVRRITDWLQSHTRAQMLVLTNLLIAGSVPYWKEKLKIPIIATLQGDDVFLDYLPEPFRQQATDKIRQLARQVDGFLTHSRFYADQMATRFDLDRSKIFVTPLGIDTEDFKSIKPKSPGSIRTIGYLARLAPEKGLHLLVDAFIRLKQRPGTDNVKLLVAGWLAEQNRNYAEEQFAQLRDQGLDSEYEYLGVVNRQEKLNMLARCDVFSVPSVFLEPKGLYALEAMASGLAVIFPSHGVFPELLEAAKTGWLFPPGDAVALADMLQTVLRDDSARESAGKIGRQFVMEYRNLQQAASDTLAVLRRLV